MVLFVCYHVAEMARLAYNTVTVKTASGGHCFRQCFVVLIQTYGIAIALVTTFYLFL